MYTVFAASAASAAQARPPAKAHLREGADSWKLQIPGGVEGGPVNRRSHDLHHNPPFPAPLGSHKGGCISYEPHVSLHFLARRLQHSEDLEGRAHLRGPREAFHLEADALPTSVARIWELGSRVESRKLLREGALFCSASETAATLL